MPRKHSNPKPRKNSENPNEKQTWTETDSFCQDAIVIRGAREHNLKNLSLSIPRNKLIVITGLSGSGKSSLAFDTIYAEGQRRYVESLSAYARQFLEQMEKPDVDSIEGLSPAIAIEQKAVQRNPRSTVGTVTEIYDYLRLLFARIGTPHCPECGKTIQTQTPQSIVDWVLSLPHDTRVQLMAPLVRQRKGTYQRLFEDVRQQGYVRVRVDGEFRTLDENIELERYVKHDIDVVVDRLVVKPELGQRLTDSVETCLKLGQGLIRIWYQPQGAPPEEILQSEHFACVDCGISFEEIAPRLFSFNNPHGACPKCTGIGATLEVDPDLVVPDPTLSIAEGAVRPWSMRRVLDGMYRLALRQLCRHYGQSEHTPWEKLPESFRKIVLYGSGDEEVGFAYSSGENVVEYRRPFEGVIPNLERRFRETESESAREMISQFMATRPCPACKGARLRPEARAVTVADKTIMDVTEMSIVEALDFFTNIELSKQQQLIAARVLKEIRERLGFLVNVGLGYLTLSRAAGSLSGGESQRIRLATQIGSGLTGVLYVLDEPSIGLHQRDNRKLIATLQRLRNLGNTVIVVEHDEETIRTADHVIDLGPGAGVHGGHVVAQGAPEEVMRVPASLTGQLLAGTFQIPVPPKRRKGNGKHITIRGARHNNLKNIDVTIPLGIFTCITGVSGSGKSSLINETLYPAAMRAIYKSVTHQPGKHTRIEGLEHLDKVIDIDQSPIGRTPRSNPATYTGLFSPIRELFSRTPEARARGYRPGRFSFNVKGGRCEACEGDGMIRIEMHFLPDVYVPCEECKGARYNRDTLEIRYKGKNIAEVLDMTVEEACTFFRNIPAVYNKLATLLDVGLGYIKLGQSATTLSGGEAQRVKLATELSKRQTGRTLYILDEPTTGLHAVDIEKLLNVLHRLVDAGNTVLVIEHNLDVIKTADWIVDLGPEGGDAGGNVVAEGTPEDVAQNPTSYTGQFLQEKLALRQTA
ncbi:MAG TPA: excinuclease ABC subunit UvrA [Candidatus Hydrogenedentes bacterium]|nr:excinuclease ABC subunit UvrA [Candidatus Hydrogenedentota bacterium]HOL77504.1 excinuclease ABC subunit UvrA [Candidatus Hydrogenedentota bacterium]HPO86617.1 excinuclease ABC subunit UvrA [Candidatus Hydrogenedentota bacterium]